MELAWETLDKNIKDKINNKKAIHSSLGAAFFVKDYKAMEGNGNIDEYSNIHPIAQNSPRNWKKNFICELDLYKTNNWIR